jgi:hypothetical protein
MPPLTTPLPPSPHLQPPQLRSDLMDCHIAICAPEVLMLFSDNFDYQHLKRDFVCGVLSEEELGNKVFTHTITVGGCLRLGWGQGGVGLGLAGGGRGHLCCCRQWRASPAWPRLRLSASHPLGFPTPPSQPRQREYAARVHNLRAYDAISRDLLQRWAFPFTPDTNVFARGGTWGPSSYRSGQGGVRGRRCDGRNSGEALTPGRARPLAPAPIPVLCAPRCARLNTPPSPSRNPRNPRNRPKPGTRAATATSRPRSPSRAARPSASTLRLGRAPASATAARSRTASSGAAAASGATACCAARTCRRGWGLKGGCG